jgi:hypothetical protein
MVPVVIAIIMVGGLVGPLQPIAIEIAVECTYPAHESAITAIQQLAGNLFSSILTPVLSAIRNRDTDDFVRPNWVIAGLIGITGGFFFNI